MKCAVIGGGIGGLAGGWELARRNHEVHIFEAAAHFGGVTTTVSVPGGRMEGTYHHIFLSDEPIRRLIRDTGLESDLVWQVSPMGFFDSGRIYRFGRALELLNYKPLPCID